MDTIGFVAPKHGVGTSTLVAGLADAIATEHGPVHITDVGPNQTLTRRYEHRTNRSDITIGTAPAAHKINLIDCPPATHPDCLATLNQCDVVVIVTNTSSDTLDKLDALAELLRNTTATALGIVITRTHTDTYQPFETLPADYEHPALTKLFDQACAPTATIVGYDYAHVTALNTGRYLSELEPARPDLTNTFLRLNDELDVLYASAKRTSSPPAQPTPATPQVRGVTVPFVSPPTEKIADVAAVVESFVEQPTGTTSRHEFRIYPDLDDRMPQTGKDLGELLTEGLDRFADRLRAGDLPKPTARGQRRRRTCNLSADVSSTIRELAEHLGWSQTQIANAVVAALLDELSGSQ